MDILITTTIQAKIVPQNLRRNKIVHFYPDFLRPSDEIFSISIGLAIPIHGQAQAHVSCILVTASYIKTQHNPPPESTGNHEGSGPQYTGFTIKHNLAPSIILFPKPFPRFHTHSLYAAFEQPSAILQKIRRASENRISRKLCGIVTKPCFAEKQAAPSRFIADIPYTRPCPYALCGRLLPDLTSSALSTFHLPYNVPPRIHVIGRLCARGKGTQLGLRYSFGFPSVCHKIPAKASTTVSAATFRAGGYPS